MTGRDLAPVGPVGTIDRALTLLREGGFARAGAALMGGGTLGAVLLGVYYLERVEGVRTLRPLLAFAVVLAWFVRALLVGRSSRAYVRAMWDAPLPDDAGRPLAVLRTSLLTGLGIWAWSWLLVAGSLLGPFGVLLFTPFFAIRGAFAPSWIARAACERQGGLRALYAAFLDHGGQRASGVATEAMILAGIVGLFGNLLFVSGVLVLLLRSFLGFEVATVEAFLSASNTFVVLCVGAVALILFEPLRAALSASAWVSARVRAEGLDLRAAIDAARSHASGGRGAPRAGGAVTAIGSAAALALAMLLAPASSLAQEDFPPPPDPQSLPAPARPDAPASAVPEPPAPITVSLEDRDVAVQGQVEDILGRDEFREFEDRRGEGLADLVERVFEWIFRDRDIDIEPPSAPLMPDVPLPGATFFIVFAVLLLLAVTLYLIATRRRGEQSARALERAAVTREDIRERPPASFLDEAAQLAADGAYRAALRSLYLATLVSLDRRRLIAFDPHLTNWQYLRQMPRGDLRTAFHEFTRLFDHKWYGHEPTTEDDYARCRELATDIVRRAQERAA